MCVCVCVPYPHYTVDWSDNVTIKISDNQPMCVKRGKTLFFRDCVIWYSIQIQMPQHHCWHIRTSRVSNMSVKSFFSVNKADWSWKHHCVHSTCHRAVEAGVSASWYWGAVAMPGGTIQHKWTLFQWFPAHTHRKTGRPYTASHKQTDMHVICIEDGSTGGRSAWGKNMIKCPTVRKMSWIIFSLISWNVKMIFPH